jgi:hypothetical protein
MGAHNVIPQVYYSGAWQNVTAEILNSEKIKITRGLTEQGRLRPAKIEWTFNNATDKWRPTNPTSVVYGLVGRNTAVALSCDSSVRAVCEASSWQPDQSLGFAVGPPARGLRWVDLTAEGLLRRIGLWTEPLRSPMYRQIHQYTNLRGYWPLEDPTTSTQLTNSYPGGPAGTFTGITLSAGAGPPGSDEVVASSDVSVMSGRFASASGTAGWQFAWAAKLAAAAPVGHLEMITWATTNGYRWSWSVNVNTFRITVTQGGVTLLDNSYGFGAGVDPATWVSFRVKVSVSGGTVTVEGAWHNLYATVFYGFTDTFAGTAGALSSWRQEGNSTTNSARYAHVFGVTTVADNLLSYEALHSFEGYVGETAAARFQRLCDEVGVARTVVGTAGFTWPMGAQKSDTFLDLLSEIAETEDALIFDTAGSVGLTMRTRLDLYNQTAKMALSFGTDIAPPFTEVIDDDGVHNRVTVKQRDGSEATVSLDTGPLSTLPPPDGVGEYKQTVNVNVSSEADLPQLAGWWLSRGTAQGIGGRYPQVTLDLDGNPGLITAANSVDVGDRITITGREPETIGLLVIGIVETIETHRRKLTFTCIPDTVFNPGKYDDAAARYDSASTTVNFAQTTTSTTWAIKTTDVDDVWSTTSTPYDWEVAGERVTVTAMTAPAGAGPYTQNATVTRSVNGVVKTHAVGEQIQLADPARYGL